MRCDIIIPIWNQSALTKDCIDAILKNTSYPFRIIIIDNASSDETEEYLIALEKKFDINSSSGEGAKILSVRNDKNIGFIKAVNQGIGLSSAPYICILNNDTLVMKGWLKTMISVAESKSDIGIVNPSSNSLGQRPEKGEPIELFAEKLKSETEESVEVGAALGFCMLIKREVINKIGLFDEIYGMGNFEDTDFSRRAVKEGYRCVRACGAYVYHRENASFNHLKTFDEEFKRNISVMRHG